MKRFYSGSRKIEPPPRQQAGHGVMAVWIARNRTAPDETRRGQEVLAKYQEAVESKEDVGGVLGEAGEIRFFDDRTLWLQSGPRSRIWIPRSAQRLAPVLTPSLDRRPRPKIWQESLRSRI